jgi:hypothetical protein
MPLNKAVIYGLVEETAISPQRAGLLFSCLGFLSNALPVRIKWRGIDFL